MQFATAQLNTYRQSPRKVRLIANLIRGKKVELALTTLRFANKRATGPIIKLLESAIANAKNMGMNTEALVVSSVAVNGGNILYRRLPMAHGRAFTKRKRTSHISLSVSDAVGVSKKAGSADAGKEVVEVSDKKAEKASKTKKAVKNKK